MKNKLPEKYKNNFLNKIRSFFINIFNKKKAPILEVSTEIQDVKRENIKVNNEFEKMKIASSEVKLGEDIFSIIKNNPKTLENLPLEKLYYFNNMLDEIIEKNNRRIRQLKRKVAEN